jgi:hypothetical protein
MLLLCAALPPKLCQALQVVNTASGYPFRIDVLENKKLRGIGSAPAGFRGIDGEFERGQQLQQPCEEARLRLDVYE